jgi:DNA-binding NtrC family response regulator
MKMPGMNGIEFISSLKQNFPEMKCFIYTGYGVTPEIQQALDKGLILKCLNKPMEMRDIAAIVIEALEN